MKQAFDITIVLVTDDSEPLPTMTDLLNGLVSNELIYYGEAFDSAHSKPIVYLTKKVK